MKTIMSKHPYAIPVLWLALVLLPLPALAAGSCPKADAAAQVAREAGQHWKKMLDAREDRNSICTGGDLSVPDREAIRAYKRALGEAIDARLACSGDKIDPAALQRTLAAALGGGKPGEFLVIYAQRSAAPRPLMLVRANFGLPCGDDNLLLGYAWRQGGWQRVLDWQSGDYEDISGAYGSGFSFVVLPGGQVVVAHGTPWWISFWSAFHADMIVPADGTAAQRVLFHMKSEYYMGDDGFQLKKVPGGFELRAFVHATDVEKGTCLAIFRYRVDGETVRRVSAATNGRGFVAEWLNLDYFDEWSNPDESLARAWSDPAVADAVLQARRSLREQYEEGEKLLFHSVRACAGGKNRYQIKFRLYDTYNHKPRQKWYALIRQEKNGFTMLGLGTTPDATCKSGDLMTKPR